MVRLGETKIHRRLNLSESMGDVIDNSAPRLFRRVIKLVYREGRAIPLSSGIRKKVNIQNYTNWGRSALSRRLNQIEEETNDMPETEDVISQYHEYVGLSLEDLESSFENMSGRSYGGIVWVKLSRLLIDYHLGVIGDSDFVEKTLQLLRTLNPVVQSKDSAVKEALVPYKKTRGWPLQYNEEE